MVLKEVLITLGLVFCFRALFVLFFPAISGGLLRYFAKNTQKFRKLVYYILFLGIILILAGLIL